MKRKVRRAAAIITGMVFLLAGILKLEDPVGSGMAVAEYFNFFRLGFLAFASKFTAVILALAEAITGAALIAGIARKTVGGITMLLTGFFTLVTLVLLIAAPDMDCACFGRFIHLSHAQTFIKNIVLCILCAVAFIPFNVQMGDPKRIKSVGFAISLISIAIFTIFSLAGLPLEDRTPFAPGAELFDPGQESFDNPPILSFYDTDGGYRDHLALGGPVAIVSVYNPDDAYWPEVQEYLDVASEAGYVSFVLSSSFEGVPESLLAQDGRVFCADRRTLMTLNRSNAGVTYVNDGRIIRKWTFSTRPDGGELQKIITSDATEVMISGIARGERLLQGFLLYIYAVLLLF